jgi:manganese/iron transport system substrate-binding protein
LIKRILTNLLAATSLLLSMAACAANQAQSSSGSNPLKVVATTTIVSDVVHNVGGDLIDLSTILPTGADPHSFDPTPQDVAKVADASVIFANGAGLEAFLDPMLKNAGSQAQLVAISDGIQLLQAQETPEASGQTPQAGSQELIAGDPHTWSDPNNVKIWVDNIQRTLSARDPAHAAVYAENAQKYKQQLNELDAWIRDQVAQIPASNRLLVTDHQAFTYFATRYGFEQVGTVIPGYSTLAQPSAQELAALEDAIRKLSVKAIFVGDTVNPNMEEQVASDTGIHLVFLYTGSLSRAEGPAASYLAYMRYNVSQIVEALK